MKGIALAAAVFSLGWAASVASATEGCYYGGFGYGGYGYSDYGVQYFNEPRQPYFALHPPVYYNGIQPRTMGQSPYPYLPPIAPAGPQYPPADSDSSQPQHYVRPLMVRNPYVTDNAAAATPAASAVPPPPQPAK
jgi:hypothetical protein